MKYFGMTSLLNPVTGAPLVDIAKAMALPNAMESWPTLAHPLANKVGWFDLNNIACGLLGMPLGFLVIYVVSLMGKAPSKEMQAFIDEIRKPRGRTVLEEKTPELVSASRCTERGPAGPASFVGIVLAACASAAAIVRRLPESDVSAANPFLSLLVLPPAELRSGGADVHAARARLLGADRRAGFVELHLALLLPHHRSGRRADRAGDAEGGGAGRDLAVRLRLAVLAARAAALSVPACSGACPRMG